MAKTAKKTETKAKSEAVKVKDVATLTKALAAYGISLSAVLLRNHQNLTAGIGEGHDRLTFSGIIRTDADKSAYAEFYAKTIEALGTKTLRSPT